MGKNNPTREEFNMLREEVKTVDKKVDKLDTKFDKLRIWIERAVRQMDETKVGKTQHNYDVQIINDNQDAIAERIESLETSNTVWKDRIIMGLFSLIGSIILFIIIPLIIFIYTRGL